MDSQDLIGKLLLIGIAFIDEDENLIEQYQTYGRIVSVDAQRGIAIERRGQHGYFVIPCDMNNIFPAAPGQYRLRSTGDVVVDPDLTSTWTISPPKDADLEDVRRTGFAGFTWAGR